MARASTAAAASRRKPRAAARRGAVAATDRPALLLLAAWVAYRLHPYVPVLSLEKYWHAIRPVLQDPLPHGSDPFRLCLMWLLCCMLIEAAAGAARTGRLFAIFAGGIFAAKVLIADNGLSSADIAGACVALVLWLLFFRRAPARHAILALFFAAMIAALRLAPSAPHGFGWQVLAEKAFLYGGLIWLLNRAGMRLLHATLATALLLLLTSVGAAHGVVRSAWIGVDAAEALAAGALLYAVGLSLPRLSRP
jgi:hypothetical protein